MRAKVYVERLLKASEFVKERIPAVPDVGIILGSGLGSYGDELVDPIKIPYKEIPEMLDTTVPGHSGCLIFGSVGDRKVLCLSGRSHQYEGLGPHEVQFAIRLLAVCGCKLCILTNAAGTRDPELNVGDLCPMLDHMNTTLRGYTEEALAQKDFNHLIQVGMYDKEAQEVAKEVATEMGLQTKGCVYCYNFGPCFETSAEVEGEYKMGATNFGMSTVPEVVAMKEMGVPVFAMSFATNKAAGVTGEPLTHEEVYQAAKAGEPKMKALISELIKRVPLKEAGERKLVGDDNVIARVAPKDFASDDLIARVARMFGDTKVDALIIAGACHEIKGFDAKTVIDVSSLPEFPIMRQIRMKFNIGVIGNKQVALVNGVRDLCGPDGYQLHYLISLAAKLGAHVYIQTFSSGSISEKGVKAVEDIIPQFERVINLPVLSPLPCDSDLAESLPKAILGSYHGPEFPTAHEVGALEFLGATNVTLGTVKGLQIAKGFGLQAIGITDGAYNGVLTEEDSINQILADCRASAGAVSDAVASIIQKIQKKASVGSSWAPTGAEKGITWNDTPPFAQNEQEDPDKVASLVSQLPEVDVAIILKEPCDLYESLKGRLTTETSLECGTVNSGELFGKRVALAIASRYLVRALASKKVAVVGISPVIATSDELGEAPCVAINDHINISGVYALVGRNRFGPRFPDMSHLYGATSDLPTATSFQVVDLRVVTPAFKNGIAKIGCQVVTEFGPEQATLCRHQEGTFKQLGVIVKSVGDPWTVEDTVLEQLLQ